MSFAMQNMQGLFIFMRVLKPNKLGDILRFFYTIVPLHILFCVFSVFVRVVKFVYVPFVSMCCDLWNLLCLVRFVRKTQ